MHLRESIRIYMKLAVVVAYGTLTFEGKYKGVGGGWYG